MAVPGSAFKMKCPSCEAGVTIKDASLAGKKVECPKCKFRFVVEAPAGKPPEPEGSDEKPAAPVPKPKLKPAAAKSSKNKPLPKREDEADGEVKKKLKKQKKAKSNMTLIIGAGLGVLAIGILAVAFFTGMFDGEETSTPAPKGGGQAKVTPKKDGTNPDGKDPNDPDVGKVDPNTPKIEPPRVKIDPVAADITNLLPEDSEWVMTIDGSQFVKTPIGSVLFDNGGDPARAFKRWMGFAGSDIERVACAGNQKTSFFGIIRLKKDLKLEDLQLAMQIDPTARPAGKRYYHSIKSNELFRLLNDYLLVKVKQTGVKMPQPADAQPMALALLDPKTLVIADQPAIESFLKADLKRKFQTTYVPPQVLVPPTKDAKEPTETKTDPMPKGGGEAPKKETKPSSTSNPSFLSVAPALKVMMFQVDEGKPSVVSMATRVPDFDTTIRNATAGLKPTGVVLPKSPIVGIAVRRMDDGKLDVVAGVEFDRPEDSLRAAQSVQPMLGLFAGVLTEMFKVPVGVGGADSTMPMPKMVDANDSSMSPIARALFGLPAEKPRVLNAHQEGRGGIGTQPKGEGSPGMPDPNVPNVPPTSTLSVTTADKYLLIRLQVDWNPVYHDYISPGIRGRMDMMRGEALMITGKALWHTLSMPITAMEKTGTTPPAAFPRPADQARFGVPYPPDQRVSWMVDLLPSLGYDFVARNVRKEEAWNSQDNLQAGSAWIPEFLSRENPPSSWRALVPSLKGRELGATHFVGMSGIGLDAANFPDTPEYASKLGMLGYNRQTKFADVSDGLSNTIFMIQVPPNLQRAWIRGGGSTVQGIPETESIKPFITPVPGGKKGTHILMADGSIRFLSDTTSDTVLKALSTYKGGEKVDNLDAIAPLIQGDAKLVGPGKN